MSEKIEAKERNLGVIFSDAFHFEIPDFQRPYTWTTEQVNDLLDDLEFAMGDGVNIQHKPPYFLGSIVIIKGPEEAANEKRCQIVDGQQRITTLTILIGVLRNLSENSAFQSALTNRIRANDDITTGVVGEYRLTVQKSDETFFRKYIQEEDGLSRLLKDPPGSMTDSQKRMFENAGYMERRLSSSQYCDDRRNSLILFLVQRCFLVVVSASDQSSAYRIFSVLNDRGLDLSPTDILKANIIGDIAEKYRPQYAEKWVKMEEDLGRDRFRDLFAHIRMTYMKNKMRGTLQQEFQANVLSKVKGECFIDEVLEPFADAYEAVVGSSFNGTNADSVNRRLRYLNRLDNFDWIPPSLVMLKRNRTNSEVLSRFFQYLERLAYGMFILRKNINQRIARYADVLDLIEKDEDLYEANSPLQLTEDEKSEIMEVLEGPIYTQLRVRRPLLLRLDCLMADPEVHFYPSIVTVEHVLPQTPSSTWFKSFSQKQRDLWTDRLANLVLLSRRKNSSAQNYSFYRKKIKYFQEGGVATFALTTQVVSETEWTPKVLERRQKNLIDALRKEWRLD